MIRSFQHFRTVCIITIILVTSGTAFSGISSGSSFYIKTELISESNIFEDSTDTQSFGNYFWFGMSHNFRLKRQNLQLKMLSNLAYYNLYDSENKSVNLLTLQYNYSLFKSLSLQTFAEVFNKQWYRSTGGYSNRLMSLGINYSSKTTSIGVGGDYRYNYFPSYEQFTSDYSGFYLQVNHRPSDRTMTSLKISSHSVRYSDRLIFDIDSPDSSGTDLQKDRLLTIQMGFETHQKTIIGAYFRYIVNSSNSSAASFQAASCRLLVSQKILGFYTQMIVDLKLKKYTNDLDRLRIFANPDPEQNIQNQLMLGWDRPLNDHLSLQGKFAYIKTETTFSNQFYDKWFVSIGMMVSF